MDKNWLIRTKSNHILGPVSKEKVQELYKNGSIKPDDEICSGNGFWFFLREEEMVSRFLLGNEVQGFNPISEAKDVLTAASQAETEVHVKDDDITLVGGISLSMLQESVPAEAQTQLDHVDETLGPKKKPKLEAVVKQSAVREKLPPAKKENYLKWIGALGLIILFCLLYFRKSIIRSLFNREIVSLGLISEVHAQESALLKKKLFDRSITLDEVSFHPTAGLSGFQVVSSFNIDSISCDDLGNEVHQMGIILHPTELINEKFLIKMRQCVHKMPDIHPLKRWLKSISHAEKRSKKEEEAITFLSEILNTRFNLITDLNTRTRIINYLVELPEGSLAERLLKSYFYLIIGNIARSDNLLQAFIRKSPYENWKGFPAKHSIYHKLAMENIEQIILKLESHPADRRIYQLLTQYLLQYFHNSSLLTLINDHQGASLEDKLDLKFIERFAPNLVRQLKLVKEAEGLRVKRLRNLKEYPLNEQAYWHWPFLNIDPLVSVDLVEELQRIEKEDQLWFIYLMNDEKLTDAYSKKTGKSFLPGRRQYLHTLLDRPETFMMALYKLIEFGDIDSGLVLKTINFLTDG